MKQHFNGVKATHSQNIKSKQTNPHWQFGMTQKLLICQIETHTRKKKEKKKEV